MFHFLQLVQSHQKIDSKAPDLSKEVLLRAVVRSALARYRLALDKYHANLPPLQKVLLRHWDARTRLEWIAETEKATFSDLVHCPNESVKMQAFVVC